MNVVHLYLDENALTPDNRVDLRPNGFTPAKTFHDFPIRGQEVLLHVRRRRWLDAEGNPIRSNVAYHPERLRNNETKAELLMRSRYLLMVSPEKWTARQRERAEILFELYPDIEKAYSLTHSLRMIFAKSVTRKQDEGASRSGMPRWGNLTTRHLTTSLPQCTTERMRS